MFVMLRQETESFTSRLVPSDGIGMKNLTTIEPRASGGPNHQSAHHFGRDLVAEWQQRGPETLSGHSLRKLRVSFAPMQPGTALGYALGWTTPAT